MPTDSVYYTALKHHGHLRTRGKFAARVFFISLMFLNVRSVLSHFNTRLRLFHLFYDIEVMWREIINTLFLCFIP